MRQLLLVLLIVASALESVDGQFLRRRKSVEANPPPVVVIDTPTVSSNHSQTAGTMSLEGTYADPSGDVVSMTASCPTCTDTAPDIVFSGGRWAIGAGSPSVTIVGQDNFSVASNTALTAYTGTAIAATPGSVNWTERQDTCGLAASVRAAEQALSPNASGGNCFALYTWQLAAAFAGPNYYYQFTNRNIGVPGADDGWGLVFGADPTVNQDACLLIVYPGSIRVSKKIAGVTTPIGSPVLRSNLASDIYRVHVNATAIKVYVTDMVTPVIDTTDTFCDDNYGADSTGVFFGDVTLNGLDDPSALQRIDDLIATDLGSSSAGLGFALGTHEITVCATDSSAQTACDLITVTRAASDTTPPSIAITSPSGAASSQITAAFAASGIADDNVLVSSVACTCATCSDTTPNVTGTTTWSTASVNLSSGLNTLICTATDSAALTTVVQHDVTYSPADVTNPVVTITTNGGTNFSNGTASTVTLNGTASDTGGSGLPANAVTWTNGLGGSGVAAGTDTWSAVIGLSVGANTITMTARDGANNPGTDTIVVTRTSDTVTLTTTTLPGLVQNTAYAPAFCLQASGGTGPYTYALLSGTLPTGIAQTGSTACWAGTPTNTGTFGSLVFRVTDSVAVTDDSSSLSIVVSAEGSATAHSYYDGLVGGAYHWTHLSYRVQSEINALTGTSVTPSFFRYNPGGDTYPNAQDAAKLTVPAFSTRIAPGLLLLSAPLTANVADVTLNFASLPAGQPECNVFKYWTADSSSIVRIDDELMRVTVKNCATPGTITVTRGWKGTAVVGHVAGSQVYFSNNDLPTYMGRWRFALPGTGTDDGYTYLFTWDSFYGSEYLNLRTGAGGIYLANLLGSHKSFQFTSAKDGNGIWLEPQTNFSGATGATALGAGSTCPYDNSIHAFSIGTRSYNQATQPTYEDWSQTSGNKLHPSNFTITLDAKRVGRHCQLANKWMRWVVRIDQRALDWEYMDMWVISEGGTAFKVFENAIISAPPNDNANYSMRINKFWVEMDTSTEGYRCVVAVNDCPDLVSYLRNFVALRSAGPASAGAFSDANMSTYLVAPIR